MYTFIWRKVFFLNFQLKTRKKEEQGSALVEKDKSFHRLFSVNLKTTFKKIQTIFYIFSAKNSKLKCQIRSTKTVLRISTELRVVHILVHAPLWHLICTQFLKWCRKLVQFGQIFNIFGANFAT